MLKRKPVREKGKLGLSRLFTDIQVGNKVALVRNLSFTKDFPDRFQGKTGIVTEQRGDSLIVEFHDGNVPKSVVVKRINLKKLSN